MQVNFQPDFEIEGDFGDGDDADHDLLLRFLLCLSHRAAARSPGVSGVMQSLIMDALRDLKEGAPYAGTSK